MVAALTYDAVSRHRSFVGAAANSWVGWICDGPLRGAQGNKRKSASGVLWPKRIGGFGLQNPTSRRSPIESAEIVTCPKRWFSRTNRSRIGWLSTGFMLLQLMHQPTDLFVGWIQCCQLPSVHESLVKVPLFLLKRHKSSQHIPVGRVLLVYSL